MKKNKKFTSTSLHYTTPLQYSTLHSTLHSHYTLLYTTLHYITHCTTLQFRFWGASFFSRFLTEFALLKITDFKLLLTHKSFDANKTLL